MTKVARFTGTKPCDIVACKRGCFFAIETKQIKKLKAFGRTDMRPSQIENLDRVVATGGFAYVMLNVRSTNPRMNRLYVFDWAEWGKKLSTDTIKKKELEELDFIESSLDDKKKIYFDLWPYV